MEDLLPVLRLAAAAETPVLATTGTPFSYEDWMEKLCGGLPSSETPARGNVCTSSEDPPWSHELPVLPTPPAHNMAVALPPPIPPPPPPEPAEALAAHVLSDGLLPTTSNSMFDGLGARPRIPLLADAPSRPALEHGLESRKPIDECESVLPLLAPPSDFAELAEEEEGGRQRSAETSTEGRAGQMPAGLHEELAEERGQVRTLKLEVASITRQLEFATVELSRVNAAHTQLLSEVGDARAAEQAQRHELREEATRAKRDGAMLRGLHQREVELLGHVSAAQLAKETSVANQERALEEAHALRAAMADMQLAQQNERRQQQLLVRENATLRAQLAEKYQSHSKATATVAPGAHVQVAAEKFAAPRVIRSPPRVRSPPKARSPPNVRSPPRVLQDSHLSANPPPPLTAPELMPSTPRRPVESINLAQVPAVVWQAPHTAGRRAAPKPIVERGPALLQPQAVPQDRTFGNTSAWNRRAGEQGSEEAAQRKKRSEVTAQEAQPVRIAGGSHVVVGGVRGVTAAAARQKEIAEAARKESEPACAAEPFPPHAYPVEQLAAKGGTVPFGRDDVSQRRSEAEAAPMERRLMELSLRKDRLEAEYGRMPITAGRTAAERRHKADTETELTELRAEMSFLRTELRGLRPAGR